MLQEGVIDQMEPNEIELVTLDNLAQEKLTREIIAAIKELVVAKHSISNLDDNPSTVSGTPYVGLKGKPQKKPSRKRGSA